MELFLFVLLLTILLSYLLYKLANRNSSPNTYSRPVDTYTRNDTTNTLIDLAIYETLSNSHNYDCGSSSDGGCSDGGGDCD